MPRKRITTEPVRIKTRAKPWVAEAEHEGSSGIWKMVYADFATAMMAFFLILWLATTASEAQRDLLADYFNPVAVSRANSGADGALSGRSTDTIGALTSPAGRQERAFPVSSPPVISRIGTERRAPYVSGSINDRSAATEAGPSGADEARFSEIENAIKLALENSARLRGLARNVIFERNIDGLHIHITDDRANSMFEKGRAALTQDAESLFKLVGKALARTPNYVRITGHTDAERFSGERYGNWELSADRANAARRSMGEGGLAVNRIYSVEGRAESYPLNPEDIYDIRNRRVEIAVLASVPQALDLYTEPTRRPE